MPQPAAGFALLEQGGSAGRAGIGLLPAGFTGERDLVHGTPRPEHVFPRTGPDRVFAHGAEETLVGFPVLLRQPLGPREGHDPYHRHKNSHHGYEQTENEDIFEVPGRKIFVDHQGGFYQYRASEGQKKRKVDASPFSHDKGSCRGKQRQQYGKLKGRKPEIVFLHEPSVFHCRRLPLLSDLFLQLLPLRLQCPFPFRQP